MFLTQDLRNRKMAAVIAYINRLSLAGYRPETRRAREKCARSFAQFIHPTPLTKATRADVEAFLARDLKPESRRAYRAHLRGFYAFCLDEGLITEDPTVKVPPIRIPRAAPRPMSGDDLALALDHADPRMRAWLLLMVLAGLRCIEVAHLRPRDLLPTEAGTLLFLRECKGGGSAMVPAHPAVLEALAVLPIRDRLWWDVSPQRVSAAVGAYLRSLGIDATAHQLRHTAGTSWYRASGHDVITTAALLRHASISSTQTYAAADPTRAAEVVARVALPT
jgi:integrase